MYLDSVTISGFKSFPHKTSIKLHPGINCIIGPNGCGKSNIIDAIRWALGEGKISLLRARTMEELIFHGTERRPQRGMAEVSLGFINDGVLPIKSSEVVIKRKLTRSGDNEFTINYRRVLQRDVIELFESVNPQGYSLLSREEIDSVLSGDPYYRRRTVEEVAGIATYRNHKLSTLSKLEHIKTDIEKLDNVISEVSEREIKLRSEARRAARYEKLHRDIGHLRWILIRSIRKKMQGDSEKISLLKTRVGDTQKKIKDLEDNKSSIMGMRRKQEARDREMGNRIVLLEKRESALKEKRENLKVQYEENLELKEKVMKELIELGKARRGVAGRSEKNSNLLESKRGEIEMHPQIDKSIYEKRDKITKEIENLQDESFSVKENLIVTRTMIESRKKRINDVRAEIEKAKARRKILEKELNETREIYKNHRAPANDMEEIEDALHKLEEERARFLIYMKDVSYDEDFTRLGDVINPKHGKERIVYGALGSILTCIIVNKVNEVLFKSTKRREFICRELLPDIDINEDYEDLSSYVNLDEDYKHLEPILHKFIVASDIESAISIQKSGVYLPIVTENGELLTELGVIGVGDPEVRIGKTKLEKELEGVDREIKGRRALLEKKRGEKLAYEKGKITLDLRIKELKKAIGDLDEKIGNLEEELKRDIQIDTKTPEKALLHLSELISEKGKIKARFEENIAEMDRIIEERKSREIEISKLESEQRFLRKELKSYDRNLESLRDNLSGITEKERLMKDDMNELASVYKEVTKELGNLRRETGGLLDVELTGGVTDLLEIEKRIDDYRNSLDNLREERHKVEIELARAETRAKELEARGVVKLQEPYDVEDAEDRLQSCERKLQSMLPVNPLAVKEHEEIKERLNFLREEREDIARARQIIEVTIKLLDEQARAKVREAITLINERFNYIFRLLFQGGEARLLLRDGDPLVANIDIGVSPKGKKLKRIEQLSTGERTLSVIALFFGVYELKPTPFMILDEVDAPLDDANLLRFLSLIKKEAEKTQYILITHNKQTMESANYLYGVTMEEPGVSKIVSVRLRE